VSWQIAANSDGNQGVDASGNTYFTLSAVATQTPGSFVVTTTSDSGQGSLRQALANAAAHPGPDIVTFDPGFSGTINLANPIVIDDVGGVTIDAIPLQTSVTVSGNGAHRVFQVGPGTTAAFKRLTITGGSVTGELLDSYGGGVFVEGALTLTGCRLTGNVASKGAGAYVRSGASLTLIRSTVFNNSADFGGGIQNEGTFTAESSTFALNTATTQGGAISAPFGAAVGLTQTTVASNSAAGQGGGLIGDHIAITNCIIAGNSAPVESQSLRGFLRSRR
jgi:hypothetical protein